MAYDLGMSERYSVCTPCAGSECFVCGGTGYSGDTTYYQTLQDKWDGEREKKRDFFSARETHPRFLREEQIFSQGPRTPALDAAVIAFETHMHKQKEKERRSMSNVIQTPKQVPAHHGYTDKEVDLIKKTVAKNATDEELALFFYRAKALGLNPLMPGQIFFIKYGSAAGTIVVGIDGMRARAHATGKLSGCERGIIRNEQGECTGAWANIYRSDWTKPAHEEVSLHEYNTGQHNWKKMPETMIKKVAEVAALRLAFPSDLGGLYISEEMDQAEKGPARDVQSQVERKPSDAQIKRLFAINKAAGLSSDDLKNILFKDYGHESTKDITMDEYNELCDRLQGPLPIAQASLEGKPYPDQQKAVEDPFSDADWAAQMVK